MSKQTASAISDHPNYLVDSPSVEEGVAKKLEKHLQKLGLDCQLLSDGTMDFEYDYPRISLNMPASGIASRGVLLVRGSNFNYIDILKKKVVSDVPHTTGSPYGDWYSEGILWKIRYFLSFPSNLFLGPLQIGTLTKLRQGRFTSKVEDFEWNGYGRLTTLPPGLVRDNVVEELNSDQRLRELMMKTLLKERTIMVSVYSPKHRVDYQTISNASPDSPWLKYKPKVESNAKIVMTSQWKPQYRLFVDKNVLETYERIAGIIRKVINNLQYHLIQD